LTRIVPSSGERPAVPRLATRASASADASAARAGRSSHRDKRTDANPGGEIMVRYFYAWTPLVIVVGTIVFLTIPYLALALLTIVSLVALKKLAWTIVGVLYTLSRAISRRWQGRSSASPRTTAALSPAGRQHA
jgi:hypothetical protein